MSNKYSFEASIGVAPAKGGISDKYVVWTREDQSIITKEIFSGTYSQCISVYYNRLRIIQNSACWITVSYTASNLEMVEAKFRWSKDFNEILAKISNNNL